MWQLDSMEYKMLKQGYMYHTVVYLPNRGGSLKKLIKYPPETAAKNKTKSEKKFPPGNAPSSVIDIKTIHINAARQKKLMYPARFPKGGHISACLNLCRHDGFSGKGLYSV